MVRHQAMLWNGIGCPPLESHKIMSQWIEGTRDGSVRTLDSGVGSTIRCPRGRCWRSPTQHREQGEHQLMGRNFMVYHGIQSSNLPRYSIIRIMNHKGILTYTYTFGSCDRSMFSTHAIHGVFGIDLSLTSLISHQLLSICFGMWPAIFIRCCRGRTAWYMLANVVMAHKTTSTLLWPRQRVNLTWTHVYYNCNAIRQVEAKISAFWQHSWRNVNITCVEWR